MLESASGDVLQDLSTGGNATLPVEEFGERIGHAHDRRRRSALSDRAANGSVDGATIVHNRR
ncbi:hypothetical protein A7U43_23515 [Mycobacterium adipatum]|uniref:Uncharacterized protein n=1 Tax=Mycobacterium adipatum TaxID=1682113 RepID=A0A172US92_9MYCO|nr:hypothetical protein [Mycobacterium adipatum]ANE81848.1 hypothetical protein A7U43_23515 [Mycobacterium adipatum]MBI5736409.1 hypothetical protein [Mycolicibacterium neoaurum]